jgi:hypothetical protein
MPFREQLRSPGVQFTEDARNLTSLRARRWFSGELEQPQEISAANFLNSISTELRTLAEKTVEVCDVAQAPKRFGRSSR